MERKAWAHEVRAFTTYRAADGSEGVTALQAGIQFKNGLYTGGAFSASGLPLTTDNITISGSGGNGYIQYSAQTSDPTLSLVHTFANSAGRFAIAQTGSTAHAISFNNGVLTADRDYLFQNKSGTLAMTNDNVSQFVNDAGYVPGTRTISEGAGLAGNTYSLAGNVTLAMGTPGTLSIASTNGALGTTHSHAITASSNPGAAASLLSTDVNGQVTLRRTVLSDYGRSSTFASGISGWNVNGAGDAEFNNLTSRGEIRAAVFTVNEIAATAGTHIVSKSASTLSADCTTPATIGEFFHVFAKNSIGGAALFAVNDRLLLKSATSGGVLNSWATVSSIFAGPNNTTDYVVQLSSGSTNATFPAGTAIADYGQSGDGVITLSADGTVGSSANLSIATHAGSPWSTQTLLTRLGNLNNSYGYSANTYGLGLGDFNAGLSWLTVDPTNGLQLFGGASHVRLNSTGLELDTCPGTGGVDNYAARWINSGTTIGSVYESYVSSLAELALNSRSKAADTTGASTVSLNALNDATKNASLALVSQGSSGGNKSYAIFSGSSGFGGLTIGSNTIPAAMLDVNKGTAGFEVSPGLDMSGATQAFSVLLQSYNRSAAGYAVFDFSAASYRWGIAGTSRLELSASGALSVFVGGALKTVEVGAADSGGAGYRMLRVFN